MPPLTIFDCDGGLVDSEAIVVKVECELLVAAGFDVTEEEIIEHYVGLSFTDVARSLEETHGREVPPGLLGEVERLGVERYGEELQAVDGMGGLLADLPTPRCVASGSRLSAIELSLTLTDLADYFEPEHLFSSEMVPRGKPAPDLFLYAAEAMGSHPSECLVVEDSPHGVKAAVAAGMAVVGFVGGRHARPSLTDRLHAAGASVVVGHPTELLALVA